MASGETRLYDSIYDVAVGTFRHTADASRPWILIVVTDGDDNCSTRAARKCGQDVYSGFSRVSNNYVFVVGVGNGVNAAKMKEVIWSISIIIIL